MTATTPYHHIYLSPHYDDASLSCGGAIYQQVQAGEKVLVITICAAEPPDRTKLSPFAQLMHDAWGDAEAMVALRRAEDEASMALLGCDFERLTVLDCIYRGEPEASRWYYNSDAEIFGEVAPADVPLAEAIAQTVTALRSCFKSPPSTQKAGQTPPQRGEIRRFSPPCGGPGGAKPGHKLRRSQLLKQPLSQPGLETTLYAPLTVGHHVDHQLVHMAARQLQAQGWPVLFYEDYPYADLRYPFTRSPLGHDNAYTLAKTLATPPLNTFQPQVRPLLETALQTKIKSIAAYASQLQILFGGRAAMSQAVRVYAEQVGQGPPAERLWVDSK